MTLQLGILLALALRLRHEPRVPLQAPRRLRGAAGRHPPPAAPRAALWRSAVVRDRHGRRRRRLGPPRRRALARAAVGRPGRPRRRRRAARRHGRAPVRLQGRPRVSGGPRPHRRSASSCSASRCPQTHGAHSSFSRPGMVAFEAGLFGIGGLLIMGPRVGARDEHHGVMLAAAAGVLFGVCDVAVKALTGIVGHDGCSALLLSPGSSSPSPPRSAPSTPRPARCRTARPSRSSPSPAPPPTSRCIAGGILVFGDPMPGDALGIVVQAVAFVIVIVASALTPAPVARRSARRARRPLRARSLPRRTSAPATTRRGGLLRSPSPRRTLGVRVVHDRPTIVPKWRTATGHGDDGAVRTRRRRTCRSWPSAICGCTSAAWAPTTDGAEVPIIVRGEGCYVWDEHGNRYLDGLSALFCSNIGHGRADVAQAGADQAQASSSFFTNWSYAHPRAIELAARIASLAPGDLNRVFFTSGGSEAVESRSSSSRQYHKLTGNPNKTKIIAREIAYHGTTLGALTATGITGLREPFEPLTPGGCHVAEHEHLPLRRATAPTELAEAIARADRVRGAGHGRRRDPRAGAERRRLLHAARGLLPARARDLRRATTCCSSPTRSSARGAASASGSAPQRYGYRPDIITTAKGITSAYAPMGAMIASDRVAEPFIEGARLVPARLHVRRAPGRRAVALANIDVFEDEGILEQRARERGRLPRDARVAARHPDRRRRARRRATSRRSSSSRTARRRRASTTTRAESLLRGFLSGELFRRGLICRADDRGDPVIQLAPPLIAGPEQFEEIEAVLRPVLEEASRAPTRALALSDARADRPRAARDLDVELLGGRGRPRRAGALGAHLRAARPDAVAVGRRAAAHHGDAARPTPSASAAFVARLADHGLAGLGFGTGFAHEHGPAAMRRGGARRAASRSSRCPTSSPFIAVTERRSRTSSTSSTRCCGARSPRRSACSASSSASAGSTRSPAALATLDRRRRRSCFDGRGELLARARFRRALDARGGRCARARAARPGAPRRAARLRARARRARRRARSRCRSAATGPGAADGACRRPGWSRQGRRRAHRARPADAAPGRHGRRARAAAPPRRRHDRAPAGGRRARRALVAGELAGAELARRLEPFGLGERVGALVLAPARARVPTARGRRSATRCARGGGGLVAQHGRPRLRAAARRLDEDELFELAERVAARVARTPAPSRPARRRPRGRRRRARATSFHEARCALEARDARRRRRRLERPTARRARAGHLPRPRLLPAAARRCRTPTRCGSSATRMLGPIETGEGHYGGELMRSLEAFIECNGQWEARGAAAVLPPPHAALPDAQGRGADRPRPLQRARPDRVLARPARARARRWPRPSPRRRAGRATPRCASGSTALRRAAARAAPPRRRRRSRRAAAARRRRR